MAKFDYAGLHKSSDALVNYFAQGKIELIKQTPGAPDPAEPWKPVAPVTVRETVPGVVRGVSSQLIGVEVGGTVILSSDRQALCNIPKTPYKAGDTLTVDGAATKILRVENIPAAGPPLKVRFIIRG